MSNRIVGNVIIVDSAMGNSPLLGPGSSLPNNLWVNAVKISLTDTSNTLAITGANTTDVVVFLDKNDSLIHFSASQSFGVIKVPTLTAGTAWIYLA